MTAQVDTSFVTRDEFRAAVDDLNAKVQGLYNLADRLGYSVTVPAVNAVPESVSDVSAPRVRVAVVAPGVDYAAVAYGLTTLRDKVANVLGRSADLTDEYADAVEWFVGCFVGDAAFDAASFRRNAGV